MIAACIIIGILLVLVWYYFIRSEKYFHEPKGHPHYDKRYFKNVMTVGSIQEKLKELFPVLSKYLISKNIKFWLLYGTLLGYYRDKDMIPWDDDIDVGVLFDDLDKLPERKIINGKYLWDRNIDARPCYHDGNNIVIARLICMETGVFIDIFGQCIRKDEVMSSDGNIYDKKDIFPLVQTTFLGSHTYVPQNVKKVLTVVYKDLSIPKDRVKEYEEYRGKK